MDDIIIAAIRRRLKTKLTDLGNPASSRLKPGIRLTFHTMKRDSVFRFHL